MSIDQSDLASGCGSVWIKERVFYVCRFLFFLDVACSFLSFFSLDSSYIFCFPFSSTSNLSVGVGLLFFLVLEFF